MSVKLCRECGRRVSPDTLLCPSCSAVDPAGDGGTLAAIVAVLYCSALGAGLLVLLLGSLP
jgi:hypothetical protein